MIICADDYGLAPDINAAILELAGEGRVTAVSCMVNRECLTQSALDALLALGGRIDIGLHLDLAGARPAADAVGPRPELLAGGRFPEFGDLLRLSLRHALRREDFEPEIRAQYDTFVRRAGRPPDFIDSHLHVHQFRGIRDALVGVVAGLPAASRPYLRNAAMPLGKLCRQRVSFWKNALIGLYGRRMLERVRAAGLATNDGFAGIYDYREWRHYAKYLARFARCMESDRGILMVHPGLDEAWRRAEYAGLKDMSPEVPRNRFSHGTAQG